MKIYDISLELKDTMVCWENQPPPEIVRYRFLERGDTSNTSRFGSDLHAGTHVDAPLHYLPNGKRIEDIDLGSFCGACYVAEVHGPLIDENTLETLNIPDTRRLLFKTGNGRLYSCEKFSGDYVALDRSGAEWLTRRALKLVGIDYLSIDRYGDSGFPAHRLLLAHDIVLLEGLDLRGVPSGHYYLNALPLKIAGVEAAPVRAVLFDIRSAE